MTGATPILTKGLPAGSGGVTKRRLVKLNAAGAEVVHATDATAAIVGVVGDLDAAAGKAADVHMAGIAEVEAGGNVTDGMPLTAGTAGVAVDGTPSAGNVSWIAGIALADGASGDIIPMLLAPSRMTTET